MSLLNWNWVNQAPCLTLIFLRWQQYRVLKSCHQKVTKVINQEYLHRAYKSFMDVWIFFGYCSTYLKNRKRRRIEYNIIYENSQNDRKLYKWKCVRPVRSFYIGVFWKVSE